MRIKSVGKVERITSILGMMRGLMFSKKRNLLFVFKKEQEVGIHMLFVFFPIIVVWMDEKKRIKAIKVMKPFVSLHEERAKYVLEVPYDKRVFNVLKKKSKLSF